jgi:hypothetical protein
MKKMVQEKEREGSYPECSQCSISFGNSLIVTRLEQKLSEKKFGA